MTGILGADLEALLLDRARHPTREFVVKVGLDVPKITVTVMDDWERLPTGSRRSVSG